MREAHNKVVRPLLPRTRGLMPPNFHILLKTTGKLVGAVGSNTFQL